MRILWVKANKILPVHSGGDIRSYNIARELGRAHDLTFLSYYGGKPDSQYDTELRQHFPGAVSICTQNPEPHVLDYIKRLLLQAPYAVSRFSSPRVKAALSDWFQGQRFDVAVCDFLDAAVNFPRSLAVPTVLFQHNVESEIWRRHAATQPNPARRVMYRVEFGKMCRYERKMVRKFHHVIAVSEHDRRLMNAWVEASRITVVPTGVDLQQFKPAAQRTSGRPLVIFVGAMDWQPNVDAVG
ncbi:MAG TPA: glycosyltransferase, partial [Terriglobales bacterium]